MSNSLKVEGGNAARTSDVFQRMTFVSEERGDLVFFWYSQLYSPSGSGSGDECRRLFQVLNVVVVSG